MVSRLDMKEEGGRLLCFCLSLTSSLSQWRNHKLELSESCCEHTWWRKEGSISGSVIHFTTLGEGPWGQWGRARWMLSLKLLLA